MSENAVVMKTEIKKIVEEEGGKLILVILCHPPRQKETPQSNGRKELDENNRLFSIYSEEHREEMKEYRNRVFQIHLGEIEIYQDGRKI